MSESCYIVKKICVFFYLSLDNLGNRIGGCICDNMIILTHKICLFVEKCKRDCIETRDELFALSLSNYQIIYIIYYIILCILCMREKAREYIFHKTDILKLDFLEIFIIIFTHIYMSIRI